MTTVTIDNIPEAQKAEYQSFFRMLVKEYDLEELEDKLLGIHMMKNDVSSTPINLLRNKYAGQLS